MNSSDSSTTMSDTARCDICSDGHEASSRCSTCRQNLCESCCLLHSRLSATLEHRLSAVGQNDSTVVEKADPPFVTELEGNLDVSQMYKNSFTSYVCNSVRLAQSAAVGDETRLWSLSHLQTSIRRSQEHGRLAGGELGLMRDILRLIEGRMETDPVCDDIMVIAWQIIVSLTDDIPSNCQLFVDYGGLQTFSTCVKVFGQNVKIKEKFALALGNLSECKSLRPHLMTSSVVTFFRQLSRQQDAEPLTRFASIAVLVHLVSEGEDQWQLSGETFTFNEVVSDIYSALEDWSLGTDLGVAFRSLKPMLDLAENFESPISQYWAGWTILNCIMVQPDRYCDMLWKEHGQEVLESVAKQQGCAQRLKDIIGIILESMA